MYEKTLTPVFTSIEKRKAYIDSLPRVRSQISDWYAYLLNIHQAMVEIAEWSVYENWKNVDWKNFAIEINGKNYDNSKHPKYDGVMGKLFKSIDEDKVQFKKVSFEYDFVDGDLYINIDGVSDLLDDERVVDAAIYIENNLK